MSNIKIILIGYISDFTIFLNNFSFFCHCLAAKYYSSDDFESSDKFIKFLVNWDVCASGFQEIFSQACLNAGCFSS